MDNIIRITMGKIFLEDNNASGWALHHI
jgi:hypothetical protein